MGNLEVVHSGTSILYDWDILGSSIYIVDILRIDDLRIDDQSSILRSSIHRVFVWFGRFGSEGLVWKVLHVLHVLHILHILHHERFIVLDDH